jgi:hypothetical protein
MAHAQDPTHPTGVAVIEGTDETSAYRPRERKAAAALALRIGSAEMEPLSYDEIARVLGYPSAQRAQQAVETALEKEMRNDPKNRARMRELISRKQDQLLRAVWKKAMDPEHPEQLLAVQRAESILEKNTKLHGIAAPTEVTISSPSVNEIEAWVAKAYEAANGGHVEEGDIFDAEVVEPEALEA